MSLGFCPDLEVKRPFCGTRGWNPGWDSKKKQSWLPEYSAMAPRDGGGATWIALQGLIDQVCAPPQTVAFVGRVPHSKVVSLDKVGHGFSVPSRWGAAFDAAVGELLEAKSVLDPLPHVVRQDDARRSPDEVAARLESLGLPLEVVWPARPHAAVVFVSGDGGWADLDQEVARGLADDGIAVIGWNTLRYFWIAKTPQKFSDDLARLVDAIPDGLPVFAGGYSFGAEAVPVVVARAADGSALKRVAGLTLVAPGPYASFEVSPLDWLRSEGPPTVYPVVGALEAMGRMPVICLEPRGSETTGCAATPRPGFLRDELPGGHHFDGDYGALSSRIAAFVAGNSVR